MKERPVKPAVYTWNGNNVLSVCPLYPWKWSSYHLFGLIGLVRASPTKDPTRDLNE